MAKLGVTSGVLLIAIIAVLFGGTSSPSYASITWLIVVAGLVLTGMNIFGYGLHGDTSDKGVKYFFAIVLVIILLFGISFTGMMPAAPKATLPQVPPLPGQTAIPGQTATMAGTGQSYIGQLDFIPVNGSGMTYTAAGKVAFVDGTPTRNDFMKLLSDTGESAVKFQGVSSRFMSVSSGNFQETQLSGKVGDKFSICGYLDAVPGATDNISFCKPITLTGFNPQSGSNGGIWGWKFDDGGIRHKWPSYAQVHFYDSTETNRVTYTDAQGTALTGRSVTIYVYPNQTGQAITDAYLYLESASANASSIKKVIITGPTGKSVTYTALQNSALLSSDNPISIAAPALVTSTNTQYAIGKFPEDGYIRTSSSDKGRYTIEIQYDHPAAGNWIFYLQGVQNFGALTSTGGHFDFNQGNGFQVNATQFTTGTTVGFSG